MDQRGGAVFRDFQQVYPGFDWERLFAGGHDPAAVLFMIHTLPRGSAYVSQIAVGDDGWESFLDYTADSETLASIYDAINGNTRATGNFKRPPKFQPYPRPTDLLKKVKKSKPKTVAQLHQQLSAIIGSGNFNNT